jgi:putative DNA primase/helicase
VEILKSLTGQDTMRGEHKFQKPITFINEAMVIISANEAIHWTDPTSGLARRRISVGFRYPPPRDQIRELLTFHPVTRQPEGELAPYLPGLLNWVLEIDEEEMRVDLLHSPSQNLLDQKIRGMRADNSIAAWADEQLVADSKAKTPIGKIDKGHIGLDAATHLYPSYYTYCEEEGLTKKISKNRFRDLLEDLCCHQLGLTSVYHKRTSDGVFFFGLRLRKPLDRRTPTFLRRHLKPPT